MVMQTPRPKVTEGKRILARQPLEKTARGLKVFMDEAKFAQSLVSGSEGKAKTFSFDKKQLRILELALEVFINMLNGKNDTLAFKDAALEKIVQKCAEELFADIHSQGG
jgi:threonine synthase